MQVDDICRQCGGFLHQLVLGVHLGSPLFGDLPAVEAISPKAIVAEGNDVRLGHAGADRLDS